MKKLLMINSDRSLAEGKKGALYNTLEEFHKYWERIDIITPKPNFKFSISNFQLFRNVFIHPSPHSLWLQPWFIVGKGTELHKKYGFDLVTVQEYAPFYNGLGARMLFNEIEVPYVSEIHHITGFPQAADFKERIYRFLSKKFLKYFTQKAVAVRITNQNQLRSFLIQAGVKNEKLVYIPAMYIDLEVFKPINLSKEYDLIFVGRLAPNKGIDLFLETVRKMDVDGVIVGEGPLKEKIKLKIKKCKLKIRMHGWAKDQKEVAELINRSKILVMPSYNEGGPRVVLEAMACGLPVLATRVGIASEIIGEKGAGVLIDWNAEDIARKASRILNDEAEYSKLSKSAIEAVKPYEKKNAIKNYARSLQKLIQ